MWTIRGLSFQSLVQYHEKATLCNPQNVRVSQGYFTPPITHLKLTTTERYVSEALMPSCGHSKLRALEEVARQFGKLALGWRDQQDVRCRARPSPKNLMSCSSGKQHTRLWRKHQSINHQCLVPMVHWSRNIMASFDAHPASSKLNLLGGPVEELKAFSSSSYLELKSLSSKNSKH